MATRPTPLEPEDVLDLPLPDDISGYELVDGQPVPVSPASPQHGWVMHEVGRLLGNHIEAHGPAGRVFVDAGFVLDLPRDPRRLRGPDIAFVREQTLLAHGGLSANFARYLPELAVEIDLRGGRKPGGQQRIRDYLEAGVTLVWAIDPRKRNATVYRQDGTMSKLSEGESLDGEAVIPGFRLPLASLFK